MSVLGLERIAKMLMPHKAMERSSNEKTVWTVRRLAAPYMRTAMNRKILNTKAKRGAPR
jgi:hypothetical protein